MRYLLRTLISLLFCYPIFLNAQSLEPFSGCPGVSVAITRPGLNANLAPFQIYLIDSSGGITPSGNPINLQINGFGLNIADGFLYGIHESSNVANPFLARVDKNGNFENVGTITGPRTDQFHVAIVNTAAGTNDDKDNFYLLAVVVNLQNVLEPPILYVGKISGLSQLKPGDSPLDINYKPIDPGSCLTTLLAELGNPLTGALQDIAWNPANGNIYTYFRTPGPAPTPGVIAWFNPADSPTFTCLSPATPNIPTNDLSGLYFGNDSSLFILTTDGKDYKANTNTGMISLVAQTALPLMDGNLRGDMASCIGKKPLVAFDNCPGVSVAITRVGINKTDSPYQIYTIDKAGNVMPSGNPIQLQINGFGLNNKDGFLYALHESDSVTDPWFTRVDKFGNWVNIGRIMPPPANGRNVSVINTAAGTMDGNDNYYFTAVTADTPLSLQSIPRLFLGTISNVSKLHEGDSITVRYKEVFIGSCILEILNGLLNPNLGLLQDISFDPVNHNIYTTFPTKPTDPSPARIGHFDPFARFPVLNCITPEHPNPPIEDMCGLFSGDGGNLFILTIDGKFYKGNTKNGEISLITQTALPLLGNNLRGDMASCIPRNKMDNDHPGMGEGEHDRDDHGDNDQGDNNNQGRDHDGGMRIAPNPIQSGQMSVSVNSQGNEQARLQIIGPNGSPVQTTNIVLVPGSNQFQLDVSQLTQGVYSAILFFASGRVNITKFVKL